MPNNKLLSAEELEAALQHISKEAGYGYTGPGNGYCKCPIHLLSGHLNACDKALHEAEAKLEAARLGAESMGKALSASIEAEEQAEARIRQLEEALSGVMPYVRHRNCEKYITASFCTCGKKEAKEKADQALAQPAAPTDPTRGGICGECGGTGRLFDPTNPANQPAALVLPKREPVKFAFSDMSLEPRPVAPEAKEGS